MVRLLLAGVFVPILIGLGLAYLVNPLLKYSESHWKLARPATIGLLLAILLAVASTVGLFVIPLLDELKLSAKVPDYVDTLAVKFNSNLDDEWVGRWKTIGNQLPGDVVQLAKFAVTNTGVALGIVSDVIASTLYVFVSLCLIPIYFFFFAWHFNPMLAKAEGYLPELNRRRVLEIVGKMDQAVGVFLRGRLIVTIAMMVMFSIAFCLAGVPYWFLLGCFTGLLSFVPYLAVIGWRWRWWSTWVDVTTGGGSFSWVDVLLLPTVAYGVVQLLEGWLLTPWIQSKSMEMNPVAILIVVLIGGSVGGLYGLLLAIPIAGCGRILCEELLLPKLEDWAKNAT